MREAFKLHFIGPFGRHPDRKIKACKHALIARVFQEQISQIGWGNLQRKYLLAALAHFCHRDPPLVWVDAPIRVKNYVVHSSLLWIGTSRIHAANPRFNPATASAYSRLSRATNSAVLGTS